MDLTKPIDKKEVMAADREQHGESCFSHLWNMEFFKCRVCSDKEVCGIMYNARQKKFMKQVEVEEGPFLDTADFEAINKGELMLFLKLKPRTLDDLVQKVATITGCDDNDTVVSWSRSFIKDSERLGLKDGIIKVKDNN